MNILDIKFIDETETSLRVTLDDGSQMFTNFPYIDEIGQPGFFIQKWIDLGNSIEPAFTSAELLSNAKRDKIEELRFERLTRIQYVLPGVNDDQTLELISGLWKSIVPAAKAPTTEWETAIDIFTAGRQAGLAVMALSTVEDIQAYNVVNDPIWPAVI